MIDCMILPYIRTYIHTYSFNIQLTCAFDTMKSKMIQERKL